MMVKNKSTKAVLGETTRSTSMAYSFSGPMVGKCVYYTMPRIAVTPPILMWNGNGNGFGNLDKMANSTFSHASKNWV